MKSTLFNLELKKYPRTPHLQGSKLQKGDGGHDQTPYVDLKGSYLVVEEKMDGANAAFRFDGAGELLLQSRGHYLAGGNRESQFALFKSWTKNHQQAFLDRFEDRYVVYGEWMYEKHTVFYDALPHLFLEFDIWDNHKNCFLTTKARHSLCEGLLISHVPVLYEGPAPKDYKDILGLVGRSTAKTPQWRENLQKVCFQKGIDFERTAQQTLPNDQMEGLYIKVETDKETVGRYKWVRSDFVQTIVDNDSHHMHRMLVPNLLHQDVDIFAQPMWGQPSGMSL